MSGTEPDDPDFTLSGSIVTGASLIGEPDTLDMKEDSNTMPLDFVDRAETPTECSGYSKADSSLCSSPPNEQSIDTPPYSEAGSSREYFGGEWAARPTGMSLFIPSCQIPCKNQGFSKSFELQLLVRHPVHRMR